MPHTRRPTSSYLGPCSCCCFCMALPSALVSGISGPRTRAAAGGMSRRAGFSSADVMRFRRTGGRPQRAKRDHRCSTFTQARSPHTRSLVTDKNHHHHTTTADACLLQAGRSGGQTNVGGGGEQGEAAATLQPGTAFTASVVAAALVCPDTRERTRETRPASLYKQRAQATRTLLPNAPS